MRDIWDEKLQWLKSKEPFVIARVIKTWRSAPRKSGAGMLIRGSITNNSLPQIVGSVSGGCIESAVIEEAIDVLETGEPKKLIFGDQNYFSAPKIKVLVIKMFFWRFSGDQNRILGDQIEFLASRARLFAIKSYFSVENQIVDDQIET